MAILKFINRKDKKSKQSLTAVREILNYVSSPDKTTEDKVEELSQSINDELMLLHMLEENSSSAAIEYILNPEKTKQQLVTGINCSPETAYEEMSFTKRMYNKEGGRQYIHFVQSFHPNDRATPEIAHEIAVRLTQHEKLKNHQILIATHLNAEHLHSHFVLNTVNLESGRKWQLSAKEMELLKEYSDQLCREYGLSVIPRAMKNDEWKPDGVYRNKEKGQSWRHELYLAASTCLRISRSKEGFISNMNRLGYGVNWTDTRKHVTFITPDGNKCRNGRLGERFSKDIMNNIFKLNEQQATQKEMNERMDLVLESVNILASKQQPQQHLKKSKGFYPFSAMETQALKERITEIEKGEGFDWQNNQPER